MKPSLVYIILYSLPEFEFFSYAWYTVYVVFLLYAKVIFILLYKLIYLSDNYTVNSVINSTIVCFYWLTCYNQDLESQIRLQTFHFPLRKSRVADFDCFHSEHSDAWLLWHAVERQMWSLPSGVSWEANALPIAAGAAGDDGWWFLLVEGVEVVVYDLWTRCGRHICGFLLHGFEPESSTTAVDTIIIFSNSKRTKTIFSE